MEDYLSIFKYRLKKTFPLLEQEYPVLAYVVPPMQHACSLLIQFAKQTPINRIIIFGSSISWHFHNNSDLDICIDADLPSELLLRQVTQLFISESFEFDFVHWQTIHSSLLRDEILKGVTIYDRSIDTGRM